MPTSLSVLGSLWEHWAAACDRLTPDQWKAPTRCPGWDVAALTAHVVPGVAGLEALVTARRRDGAPTLTNADALLRALKPTSDVAVELADKALNSAIEQASRQTPAQVVAEFRRGRDVIPVADASWHTTVEYFGRGTTTVEAATVIRVVEATVHLLDLCAALPDVAGPSDGALRETADFLLALTPLAAFVELATGRDVPNIFPVHS